MAKKEVKLEKEIVQKGVKKTKKEIVVDNSVQIENVSNEETSSFKMEIETIDAEKGTEVVFIATYVNGNNIKKTKRLKATLSEDIVNLPGHLRYKVAPKLLEEADPEYVRVLKVALA